MALNGADVLLLANTGTSVAPVWTAVGSQRGVKFSESVNPIDASSKDGSRRRVLGGRYEASLSLDALYVPDDAAFLALQSAFRNRQLILVRREEEGVEIEEAEALISKMDSDFPDQDVSTIAIDLQVDDDWRVVGS